MALPPLCNPCITFWGFFICYFSLCSSKSLSKASIAKLEETVPVTLEIELNAPPIEWATREDVPYAIPIPNSAGPFTKPWAGFVVKSLTPVDIFLNKLIGFPMIFKLPTILYTWLMQVFL